VRSNCAARTSDVPWQRNLAGANTRAGADRDRGRDEVARQVADGRELYTSKRQQSISRREPGSGMHLEEGVEDDLRSEVDDAENDGDDGLQGDSVYGHFELRVDAAESAGVAVSVEAPDRHALVRTYTFASGKPRSRDIDQTARDEAQMIPTQARKRMSRLKAKAAAAPLRPNESCPHRGDRVSAETSTFRLDSHPLQLSLQT
jgi:hypothetical protein